MNDQDRLTGFKTLLASQQASTHRLEEADGTIQSLADLSPEGRLGYILRDAAIYNVAFEHLEAAVRESIDGDAIFGAALCVAMQSGKELHDLEKLFPDDGRTETTPLIEKVTDLLNGNSHGQENERFLSVEEQAALFKEMRADYAAGKVEGAHGCAKDAYEKILDGKAQIPVVQEKDNGIER